MMSYLDQVISDVMQYDKTRLFSLKKDLEITEQRQKQLTVEILHNLKNFERNFFISFGFCNNL